jgi:hypothetical protein
VVAVSQTTDYPATVRACNRFPCRSSLATWDVGPWSDCVVHSGVGSNTSCEVRYGGQVGARGKRHSAPIPCFIAPPPHPAPTSLCLWAPHLCMHLPSSDAPCAVHQRRRGARSQQRVPCNQWHRLRARCSWRLHSQQHVRMSLGRRLPRTPLGLRQHHTCLRVQRPVGRGLVRCPAGRAGKQGPLCGWRGRCIGSVLLRVCGLHHGAVLPRGQACGQPRAVLPNGLCGRLWRVRR